MNGTADDRYFEWLYSHIGSTNERTSRHTHWSLARKLYTTPFRWKLVLDANRAEDGCSLRGEFADRWGHEGMDPNWMSLPCSLLEMVIYLSHVLSFEAYAEPREWFWKLMRNVGLEAYDDRNYQDRPVELILNSIMERQYGPDGNGGFFPLRHPERDQRGVEIWYQKEAYLLEGYSESNGPQVP